MAGDPFRRVAAGEKLQISAEAWNALLDVARADKGNQGEIAQRPFSEVGNTGIIRVVNNTGGARDRLEVVGLDVPAILPADNATQFLRYPLVSAVAVNSGHVGKFAILAEPLAVGAIGKAYVSGVCPAYVDVGADDGDLEYAQAYAGDHSSLRPAAAGCAQILWKEAGTGKKFARVRLSNAPSLLKPAYMAGVNETTPKSLVPTALEFDEQRDGQAITCDKAAGTMTVGETGYYFVFFEADVVTNEPDRADFLDDRIALPTYAAPVSGNADVDTLKNWVAAQVTAINSNLQKLFERAPISSRILATAAGTSAPGLTSTEISWWNGWAGSGTIAVACSLSYGCITLLNANDVITFQGASWDATAIWEHYYATAVRVG